MAFLKIKSTNPTFSYIIVKNPNTQIAQNKPFKKSLRKGMLYGWYDVPANNNNDNTVGVDEPGPDTFNIWFKDAPKMSSFSTSYNQEFEYLDKSRYNSPYIVTHAIDELLRSAVATQDPNDTDGDYTSTFEITTVEMPIYRLNAEIMRHPLCKISMEEISPKSNVYTVTISTNQSLYWLLHFVRVLFLLHSSRVPNGYFERNDSVVTKFANSLNVINASYYYRYLFCMHIVPSVQSLTRHYELLVPSNMHLNFGNTAYHRLHKIMEILPPSSENNNVLLDIGCGEAKYSKKLSKSYDIVYAVDSDPDLQETNRRKLGAIGVTNINVVTSSAIDMFNNWVNAETTVDILITEVLEHTPYDQLALLFMAIKRVNFRTLVITVPNYEFNKNYGLADNEYRHPDHLWEPTFDEFKQLIENNFDKRYNIEISGISDSVDGIFSTSLAVITKEQ